MFSFQLNRRLHKQVNEKKHKLQAISANVSEEGKSLFLAISKVITEIRWRNSEIVVFNQDVSFYLYSFFLLMLIFHR